MTIITVKSSSLKFHNGHVFHDVYAYENVYMGYRNI